MMKSKLSLILLYAGAASGIFLCGCAASHAKLTKSPAIAVIVTGGTQTARGPVPGCDSMQTTSIIDDSDIDSLIDGAEFACRNKDFEAAHMLLREALTDIKIIQSNDSG